MSQMDRRTYIINMPDHHIEVSCPFCEASKDDIKKIGSGTFMPTMERDSQYRCTEGHEWTIIFREGQVTQVYSDDDGLDEKEYKAAVQKLINDLLKEETKHDTV